MVLGPLVLGPEHESIAVVQASRVEVVIDFIRQCGLIQGKSVTVSIAEPLHDALGRLDTIPPAMY
jgi:hypothetical protein